MKFTINRKDFVDALSIGASLAGKAKVLPVLDNVRIQVRGTDMLITSNSTQNCITQRVGIVSADSECMFLVNPNDLLKTVKSLKESELTVDVSSVTLSISHKRGRMELPILDASDFPTMEKVDSDHVYVLDSERLFGWLNTARDFASTDELRPQMCGMLLYVRGGKIGVCATDTRILFTDSYDAEGVDGDIECIISSASFAVLRCILNGTSTVQVMLDAKNISFKTDDSRLTCQLMVGRYPDFTRVIPQSNTIKVVLGKEDMMDSVNRVALFTKKANALMKIDLSGMTCRFSGADVAFGKCADDECMCDHTGDDLKIGVNAEMLLKCVNHTPSDSVTMLFLDATRPILFKDDRKPAMSMVLMPMFLND